MISLIFRLFVASCALGTDPKKNDPISIDKDIDTLNEIVELVSKQKTEKELVKIVDKVRKPLSELSIKDLREQIKEIPESEHKPKWTETINRLKREYVRIDAMELADDSFRKLKAFQEIEEILISEAKFKVKIVGRSIQSYLLANDRLPPDLETLIKGDNPFLESADRLKDPWDRSIQYDPSGRKYNDDIASIWSDGPRSNKKVGPIRFKIEIPK